MITVGKGVRSGKFPGEVVYKIAFDNNPGGSLKTEPSKQEHEFRDLNLAVETANNLLDGKCNPNNEYSYKAKLGNATTLTPLTREGVLSQAEKNLMIPDSVR